MAYFGKKFTLNNIKVYIIRKTVLSAFISLIYKNILFTSEVIALLVRAYIVHLQIFGHFSPPLSQILNRL